MYKYANTHLNGVWLLKEFPGDLHELVTDLCRLLPQLLHHELQQCGGQLPTLAGQLHTQSLDHHMEGSHHHTRREGGLNGRLLTQETVNLSLHLGSCLLLRSERPTCNDINGDISDAVERNG